MREPLPTIVGIENKHTACVHFLNPNGIEYSTTYVVAEPNLDAALENLPSPRDRLGEVAWIGYATSLDTTIAHGTTRKNIQFMADNQPNEINLATDWQEDVYAFSSLEALLDSERLPTYTAEWLARHFHYTPPDYKNDKLYKHLSIKPPLKQPDSERFEGWAACKKRLAIQVLNERPYLRERFVSRGIVREDDLPEPQHTHTVSVVTVAPPALS